MLLHTEEKSRSRVTAGIGMTRISAPSRSGSGRSQLAPLPETSPPLKVLLRPNAAGECCFELSAMLVYPNRAVLKLSSESICAMRVFSSVFDFVS